MLEDAFAFSPDPAGREPWNPDTMTHRYRRYARRVGITSSLKELRHYSATQLLAAGTDLNTVAGRLGLSKVQLSALHSATHPVLSRWSASNWWVEPRTGQMPRGETGTRSLTVGQPGICLGGGSAARPASDHSDQVSAHTSCTTSGGRINKITCLPTRVPKPTRG